MLLFPFLLVLSNFLLYIYSISASSAEVSNSIQIKRELPTIHGKSYLCCPLPLLYRLLQCFSMCQHHVVDDKASHVRNQQTQLVFHLSAESKGMGVDAYGQLPRALMMPC